jgi:hypothetical protein
LYCEPKKGAFSAQSRVSKWGFSLVLDPILSTFAPQFEFKIAQKLNFLPQNRGVFIGLVENAAF